MGRTPLVYRINNNTKNHTRPPITMAFGGIALKSVSLFFRAIEFGCAAVIIGIFSYYLATLTDHSLPISVHIKAVEGISGAAVLYTLAALVLVCRLGGIAFFSALGMVLDFAFSSAPNRSRGGRFTRWGRSGRGLVLEGRRELRLGA